MSKLTVNDIRVELTSTPKEKTPDDKLGFGTVFTDHMFVMDWTSEKGWYDPRIVPYGPIEVAPSLNVFHYAQSIFEGMKAYNANGEAVLFRPEQNFKRLNKSADRIALPELDEEDDAESEEPDKDFKEFEDSGIFIRRDYRKNISIESEIEDMFVRCFKIVTGKFKITNEQTLKEINEFNGDNKLKLNTEYTFISFPLEIENLSKYDYEYASSLSIALLNTKEQLNADKYFSDETDTYKILSGAIVERDLVFIVEKSNIEDVTDIRLKLPDLYIEEIDKTVPGLELNINIK